MFGLFPRWARVSRFPLATPMLGTLIAPDLGEIFHTSGESVRRVSLVDAWRGRTSALVAEECPGLWSSSNVVSPYRALGGGRLELRQRDETELLDAVTGATLARFPAEGRVSPDGARCASLITRTSVEQSRSSLDWRSDWTRDGDDLSERTLVHREGIAIHLAREDPRHTDALVLPVRDAYALRWCEDDAVVAWSSSPHRAAWSARRPAGSPHRPAGSAERSTCSPRRPASRSLRSEKHATRSLC